MAVQKANFIWRDFRTDGVPSTGKSKPSKRLIRERGTWVENAIAAGLSNGGLIFDTKSNLDADLAHGANASAWVIDDGANNGIYRKSGASGSGSWAKIADLPYSVVYAQNAGAGTANAVVATSSLPIVTAAYAQLVSVPFAAENTGAMTLSINGETARPLVTNTGATIPAGYVREGMSALLQIDGDGNYRLFSYGDATAIQAAAEAAQAAAEAAAASLIKRDTVALLVSDTVLAYSAGAGKTVVAAGQIIEAQGYRYEVAADDSTDHHLETDGGVKLYVPATYSNVSLVQFGAQIGAGNRAKAQTAFDNAIAFLSANGGGRLRVPSGDWYISANNDVPAGVTIAGRNRNACVIHGNGDHNGFTMAGSHCEVRGITIRDCLTGIVGTTARFAKLVNCTVSYNRIGIDWYQGYINTIQGNTVNYNTYGACIRDQSFELNILDNQFDNNMGGLGILLLGSSGANIVNNTIEGNRIEATYHGVGVIVAGINIRTNIDRNWFEYNGRALLPDNVTVNPYSVDILGAVGTEDVATTLVANCVPDEYKTSTLANLTISGALNIRGNFFLGNSTTNIQLRMQAVRATANIEGNQFGYVAAVDTRLINIIYVSGSAFKFNIRGNSVFNSDSSSTAGAFNGIGNTYVRCNAETPLDAVQVDGVDLYTKVMTLDQFKALPGATMDCTSRLPASGYASLAYDCKLRGGTKGVTTVNGTGRLRLGSTDPLPTGNPLVVILLCDPNGKFVYSYSGGGSERTAGLTGPAAGLVAVLSLPAPTSALISLSAGRFYGYCILSAADGATYFGGATRLRISDWYPLEVRNMGTAAPTSANQNCAVGDIVYNSAPAAGGPEGWVCTVAGQPGTWVAFGYVGASLTGTATYDPPSIATGALDTTQTMTVTGAALGDLVDVSFSVALAGARLEAWVSAANTVSYRFSNPTGSSIDLSSGTVKARIRK